MRLLLIHFSGLSRLAAGGSRSNTPFLPQWPEWPVSSSAKTRSLNSLLTTKTQSGTPTLRTWRPQPPFSGRRFSFWVCVKVKPKSKPEIFGTGRCYFEDTPALLAWPRVIHAPSLEGGVPGEGYDGHDVAHHLSILVSQNEGPSKTSKPANNGFTKCDAHLLKPLPPLTCMAKSCSSLAFTGVHIQQGGWGVSTIQVVFWVNMVNAESCQGRGSNSGYLTHEKTSILGPKYVWLVTYGCVLFRGCPLFGGLFRESQKENHHLGRLKKRHAQTMIMYPIIGGPTSHP